MDSSKYRNPFRRTNETTKQPTKWSEVPLNKPRVPQFVNKFPHFMVPGGSLPHSQDPATRPYSEQD